MKKFAVIVAGGKGLRMNSAIPKQFMQLHGVPLLYYSISAFQAFDAAIKIILVLPQQDIDYWKKLCQTHNLTINYSVVEGGETRYHSVKNGLTAIQENGLVAIHDGVRPILSQALLQRGFEAVAINKCVIPGIAMHDSMRKVLPDHTTLAVDRSDYRAIQTPQFFDVAIIQQAYDRIPFSPEITDDAMVAEKAGHVIHLIEGDKKNIKVTTPEDLILAESFLKQDF